MKSQAQTSYMHAKDMDLIHPSHFYIAAKKQNIQNLKQ
jgi:hypothetical protein